MRERFAPSPTGFLHLGHAFSALTAWDAALGKSASFLVRIEDIDTTRARPIYTQAIFDDLHWLGMIWPQPVMRQSERLFTYTTSLNMLISMGLCYPCSCTRRDISQAVCAPQEGGQPATGCDGAIYPGTCRHRKMTERTAGDAVRLNMARAVAHLGGADAISQQCWQEIGGAQPTTTYLSASGLIDGCGDIVLARRDITASYHLSVVVDDAAQGITHVTRGRDMAQATHIHRLLQALLRLPTPVYRHHRLIRDAAGKRLAKRDDARSIQHYRRDGASPQDIRAMVNL